MKQFLAGFFTACLLALALIFLKRWPSEPGTAITTTTTSKTDTAYIRKLEPVAIKTLDFILLRLKDTTKIHDTLYIRVPREQKRYTDDSTYTAWVSGYKPALDSLRLTKRYVYTTITEQRPVTKYKKFDFGLTAGGGLGYVSTFNAHAGPGMFLGVSAGITYHF